MFQPRFFLSPKGKNKFLDSGLEEKNVISLNKIIVKHFSPEDLCLWESYEK